ncbi:hypothetical protein ADICEAN_03160 [Cesiribacter andamanensis AMV16]|uniref:FG-GAP repeat protein n=1 Tax=Cesiribacter andamanensis AMV16 TaxID=1279009 RepID=M7NIW9_9BACT|nr:hypothetical protein ADICEAN_03160 [Cesiribacter andamanensis AMV16]
MIWNNGDGTYTVQPLPDEVQWAPIRSILVHDFDGDGAQELLLAGNYGGTKPEEGRYDANSGLLLKLNADRSFQVLSPRQSGLQLRGVVNGAALLNGPNGKGRVIFARNNETVQLYEY